MVSRTGHRLMAEEMGVIRTSKSMGGMIQPMRDRLEKVTQTMCKRCSRRRRSNPNWRLEESSLVTTLVRSLSLSLAPSS